MMHSNCDSEVTKQLSDVITAMPPANVDFLVRERPIFR